MTTKYQMWLTYNAEKEKIQLPVLPETFKTNNGAAATTAWTSRGWAKSS